MLPRDSEDDKNAIIELRAGAGGGEAGLFTLELLRMYQKFAISQGWKFEILSCLENELGGCREAIVSMKVH